MLFVVCGLFLDCFLCLFVVCWSLMFVVVLFCFVRCLVFVVCGLLIVDCCLLFGVVAMCCGR